MSIKLSASMMCADFANLKREVEHLEGGGIDLFHIDIMDGRFVDNFGMGYQDLTFIRNATQRQVEMHLMINDPERYLDILMENRPDIVYIHPESTHAPELVIEKIRNMGTIPGIAMNPGTSIASVEELFNVVDRVLVLCVNPGHVGRKFVPHVARKVDKLLLLKEKYGFELFWDGACTAERIRMYAPKGVDGFVLGTSLLFGHKESYETILGRLNQELNGVTGGTKC